MKKFLLFLFIINMSAFSVTIDMKPNSRLVKVFTNSAGIINYVSSNQYISAELKFNTNLIYPHFTLSFYPMTNVKSVLFYDMKYAYDINMINSDCPNPGIYVLQVQDPSTLFRFYDFIKTFDMNQFRMVYISKDDKLPLSTNDFNKIYSKTELYPIFDILDVYKQYIVKIIR